MAPEIRIQLCKIFEQLPDEAISPTKMTAAVFGMSERSVRRNPPTPRKQISARIGGNLVGDIRRRLRSGQTPAA
jgi:hypothetical protein